MTTPRKRFADLLAAMSPDRQARIQRRVAELCEELDRTTCVYCGQLVEGLSPSAYIAAHTACLARTAAGLLPK